jgi:histidyl-tRNA synthetase
VSEERRTLIQPRTLKGFRDYLPAAMMAREQLIETAKRVYRSYGFSPIDTPALEYAEILLGKGGAESDKQMFRFQDGGDRDVAMRFDLTVPLARFVAQHLPELGTPFKRYHVAPVWRGENTQRGRYREFVQCDFDTIGTRSIAADIEAALVIHDLFVALGFAGRFTIHVNNRKVLTGLLAGLGLQDRSVAVLRAIDKLAKIGADRVVDEIVEAAGATPEQARSVVALTAATGTNEQILDTLAGLVQGSEIGMAGVSELRQLVAAAAAAGVVPGRLVVDVSIARGLDYYTGTVFETLLDELPGIGSVCSGGRYDDLAGLYTKAELPGIGASLGLDRLLAAMEELGLVKPVSTPADVFVPWFEPDRLGDYLALAAELRAAGFAVEVFPEAKKLGQQLKYAGERGHRAAVIVGRNEWRDGTVQLKDLRAQEATTVPRAGLVEALRAVLLRG